MMNLGRKSITRRAIAVPERVSGLCIISKTELEERRASYKQKIAELWASYYLSGGNKKPDVREKAKGRNPE